jgi:hypothetical protein
MGKKGLSHIEFVISFIIFIGFIVFAFIFFNPLESNRTARSTLDYAWIEINQRTKETVDTYSVSIDSSQVSNKDVGVKISGVPNYYNATVEDADGNLIDSENTGGIINFNRNDQYFFRIRFSPLTKNGVSPTGLLIVPRQYFISSSTSEKLHFEQLFAQMNQSYYSNYNALKQELNLPNRMEFGFIVDFSDKQIKAVKEIPSGLEVISKNDRVEVIREDGRREYAEVTVLVW